MPHVCHGFVDVSDLLAVLFAWGRCAGCPPDQCASDLNGDCTVNVADLLTLIANWVEHERLKARRRRFDLRPSA
ncbi:MAG: hypothetical protein L0Y42_15150 [Phycisphaerales bacterium]|nr:hypothetical protein [Phycisphaerales bacterium]